MIKEQSCKSTGYPSEERERTRTASTATRTQKSVNRAEGRRSSFVLSFKSVVDRNQTIYCRDEQWWYVKKLEQWMSLIDTIKTVTTHPYLIQLRNSISWKTSVNWMTSIRPKQNHLKPRDPDASVHALYLFWLVPLFSRCNPRSREPVWNVPFFISCEGLDCEDLLAGVFVLRLLRLGRSTLLEKMQVTIDGTCCSELDSRRFNMSAVLTN